MLRAVAPDWAVDGTAAPPRKQPFDQGGRLERRSSLVDPEQTLFVRKFMIAVFGRGRV